MATGMALLEVKDNRLIDYAVAAYTVPGRQTAPRAELQGLMLAARASVLPHIPL